MKSIARKYLAGLILLAAIAAPIQLAAQSQQGHNQGHARYRVKILGTLGGTSSSPNGLNNKHWATGQSNLAGDETTHAVIWQGENWAIEDLGTLGGPNSAVLWSVNDDRGLTAGVSDTSNTDPYDENFCGLSPSGSDPYICLGFLWKNGRMTPLATLGGNNSYAFEVNDLGQVAGIAENSTHDPNCIPPQVLDYEAVIWGPKEGEIHQLPPLPGDAVAGASAINDKGQAVGGSNPVCMPISGTVHAVLWEKGSVTDLGNLGGALLSIAFGINEQGHVVGFSDLAGDVYTHAFLWTKHKGMQDLGTVSGDVASYAYGINSKDQVVGDSCPEEGSENGCHAFLWENGVMTDLNTLIPPNSPVYLTVSNQINDEGEISCTACVISNGACTSEKPPVLLIPIRGGSDSEADSSAAQVGGNPAGAR